MRNFPGLWHVGFKETERARLINFWLTDWDNSYSGTLTARRLFLRQLRSSEGERNGNPLLYSCLENPVDRGASWAAAIGSHRVRHDWSNLARMHALEKKMATHSSILSWRIPGTGEPGRLPSMGHTESDTTEAT